MNRNLRDFLYFRSRVGGMGEKAEWFFYGMITATAVIGVAIVWMIMMEGCG